MDKQKTTALTTTTIEKHSKLQDNQIQHGTREKTAYDKHTHGHIHYLNDEMKEN